MTPADRPHHRLLERLYHKAPCNEYYAPRLTVSEGKAELTVGVAPKFLHAAGAVHGSIYFKMLDDAAFFAANSLVADVWLMTGSFELRLIHPVTSGELKASGEVTEFNRHLVEAKAVLEGADGRVLARGSGKFVRSKVPLAEGSRIP